MTSKTLQLIKEIVSGAQSSQSSFIPRKKVVGKPEEIIINPEYKPFRRNNNGSRVRQPNDTGSR